MRRPNRARCRTEPAVARQLLWERRLTWTPLGWRRAGKPPEPQSVRAAQKTIRPASPGASCVVPSTSSHPLACTTSARPAAAGPAMSAPGGAMTPPLIAVVDRDPSILDLLDDLLGDEDFRTLRCPTGEGAHERIRAAKPALVILEPWLERPDTGCRLLADLRRDPATARTPVLICSTRVPLPAHLSIPSHWPPVATLRKPFDLDDLLGWIRTLLRLESPDGAAASAGTEQSPAA